MNMKNSEWKEQLRKRMESYEAPVPEAVWNNIEDRMTKRNTRKAVVVPLRRWATAAAVALLMAVGGTALWMALGKEDRMIPENQLATTTDKTGSHEQPDGTMHQVADGTGQPMLLASAVPHRNRPSVTNSETMDVADQRPMLMETGESGECNLPEEKENAEKSITGSGRRKTETKKKTGPTLAVENEQWGSIGRTRKDRWKMGVGVGNSFSSSGNIGTDFRSVQNDNKYGAANIVATAYSSAHPIPYDYEERSEHNMPLSVGLSASYSLSDRLSVTTGLVYSRLTSDFMSETIGHRTMRKQELHYVGIPLGVNCRIWQYGRLKTYVQAGTQCDFNVVAKSESENRKSSIKKDRVQWSLGGAAGVEYNFTKHIGLYVEPGVKYYIDNNSNVDNIFKEKPCQFNLQMGLKFNIK